LLRLKGVSAEAEKGWNQQQKEQERTFSHREISVIDHVTPLSPARIEGRVASNNSTPIVGRPISSGFNVFASGWVCGAQGRRDLGTADRTPEHPTRRVLLPSSHDLACLVEPLATDYTAHAREVAKQPSSGSAHSAEDPKPPACSPIEQTYRRDAERRGIYNSGQSISLFPFVEAVKKRPAKVVAIAACHPRRFTISGYYF
jgi:hypothetical protein